MFFKVPCFICLWIVSYSPYMKPHCLYWVYFAGGQVFIMGVFTFFSHVISQLSFISILFHVCPFDEILLTSHVNCSCVIISCYIMMMFDVSFQHSSTAISWCISFLLCFEYCRFLHIYQISTLFEILLIFWRLAHSAGFLKCSIVKKRSISNCHWGKFTSLVTILKSLKMTFRNVH